MITVKQAFERAYGPVPEGATCHMGYTLFERGTGRTWWPTLSKNGVTYLSTENGWEAQGKDTHPYMPDISDAPAFMVRELFDTAYSKVLGALEAGE